MSKGSFKPRNDTLATLTTIRSGHSLSVAILLPSARNREKYHRGIANEGCPSSLTLARQLSSSPILRGQNGLTTSRAGFDADTAPKF